MAFEGNVRDFARGTIPVREGEKFDTVAVSNFLKMHMQGLADKPLEVVQYASGASNLTYLIRIGKWEGVLRRAPFGPLPPKAHDMKREAALLSKLNPVFSLAPKPYVFCDDSTVMGSSFYVMERKVGTVLDTAFPPGYVPTPDLGKKLSYAVVDTLVELHTINYERAGLSDFGHPEGFVLRQVNGWIDRYRRAKTDDIPNAEKVMEWLTNKIPASQTATVIHYDYKLNNMLFDAEDLSKLTAVVDWEMSTIGDPLMDLAVTLSYWMEKDDSEDLKEIIPTLTSSGYFITREAFLERYADRSGRDVSGMDFYMVFAYFKLAVIVQQIYYRWKLRQTRDERFASLDLKVRSLIDYAVQLLD